jgi:large conductance mechanosensitive channel
VVDLAVGVIIGGAFGKIVSSLVNDILMPIIGIFLGGVSFSSLKITIGTATVAYGSFLQSVVDFLIIAFSVFLFVKLLSIRKKKEEAAPAVKSPSKEEHLLEEIRDILKSK